LSATHIAAILQVSRTWLFTLRKRFLQDAPKDFKDVEQWRIFVEHHRIEPIRLPPPVSKKQPVQRRDSSAARYNEARTRKLNAQASLAEINLAASKREMIPRIDVETAFATVANRVKAQLSRLVNDAPGFLLGLTAEQIHVALNDKIRNVLNGIAMDDDFYKPRKS